MPLAKAQPAEPVESREREERLRQLDSDAFASELTAHYAKAVATAVKRPAQMKKRAANKKR